MPEHPSPDVVVYVCANCLPPGLRLPRQWRQDGARVVVREVPCSGKTDGQYLLHGLEGGGRGFCVVACPRGACRLGQGNYRAEARVGLVQRLLAEIGVDPERAQLLYGSAEDPPAEVEARVRGAVGRICGLGPVAQPPDRVPTVTGTTRRDSYR